MMTCISSCNFSWTLRHHHHPQNPLSQKFFKIIPLSSFSFLTLLSQTLWTTFWQHHHPLIIMPQLKIMHPFLLIKPWIKIPTCQCPLITCHVVIIIIMVLGVCLSAGYVLGWRNNRWWRHVAISSAGHVWACGCTSRPMNALHADVWFLSMKSFPFMGVATNKNLITLIHHQGQGLKSLLLQDSLRRRILCFWVVVRDFV